MERILTLIVALFMLNTLLFAQTAVEPAVGDGTSGNPYQIETWQNLYWISATDAEVPSPTRDARRTFHYKQIADIEFPTSGDDNIRNWNGGAGWRMIGYGQYYYYWLGTYPFTGSYDGNGKTISNLYIDLDEASSTDFYYVGFFSKIDIGAEVKDLGLINVNISGKQYVGGLAGVNNGKINNCYVTGEIFSPIPLTAHTSGGLAGYNGGQISNSHFSGDVWGKENIGGLVGYNYATIDNCYSSGTVWGIAKIGGLVGYNNGNITNSNSSSQVNGDDSQGYGIGGLVGSHNSGKISNSYSTCHVTGFEYVGGMVGEIANNSIEGCYSTGSVNGPAGKRVGGFAGKMFNGTINNCYTHSIVLLHGGTSTFDIYYFGGFLGEHNNGSISNCYSTVYVKASDNTILTNRGFTGYRGTDFSATNINCFWDKTSSGSDYTTTWNDTYSGITGKTTAEMQTRSTFTDAGWDFNEVWGMDPSINNGYPELKWNGFYSSPVNVENLSTSLTIFSNYNIGFTGSASNINLEFIEHNTIPNNLPEGSVTISKYWEISNITGGNIKPRLYFPTSAISTFTGTAKIYHYTGGNWVVLPTEPIVTSGNESYLETTNYYGVFSPVTVGDENSPLPVELTTFSANVNENKVILNWQTATEVNNYGFEIERQTVETLRATSNKWETIGFVEGHGNSNSPKDYTFTDNLLNLSLGLNLNYRLKQLDFDGNYEYSDVVKVELAENIKAYKLEQNYPNPFNPSTVIKYSISNNVKSEMSNVKLIVYDILGNEVATLVNERQKSGNYEVKFNASNLSSGIYIYKLQSGSFVQTKKLMLLK